MPAGDVLPYYIPSRAPAQGRVGSFGRIGTGRQTWTKQAHFAA